MGSEAGFFVLYLLYGLVFFLIGTAIVSRDLKFSDLKIAKILWIFALFAFTHGLNEWLELFLRTTRYTAEGPLYVYLIGGQWLAFGLSFAFLFWFGLQLLLAIRPVMINPLWVVLAAASIALSPIVVLYSSSTVVLR
jgi:two-component system NtrC family sensor kinase